MGRKQPSEPNVFVRRYYEQAARDFLAAENLPLVDDLPPMLRSSKPSTARASPSSGRAASMAASSQHRKNVAFEQKLLDRRARKLQEEGK